MPTSYDLSNRFTEPAQAVGAAERLVRMSVSPPCGPFLEFYGLSGADFLPLASSLTAAEEYIVDANFGTLELALDVLAPRKFPSLREKLRLDYAFGWCEAHLNKNELNAYFNSSLAGSAREEIARAFLQALNVKCGRVSDLLGKAARRLVFEQASRGETQNGSAVFYGWTFRPEVGYSTGVGVRVSTWDKPDPGRLAQIAYSAFGEPTTISLSLDTNRDVACNFCMDCRVSRVSVSLGKLSKPWLQVVGDRRKYWQRRENTIDPDGLTDVLNNIWIHNCESASVTWRFVEWPVTRSLRSEVEEGNNVIISFSDPKSISVSLGVDRDYSHRDVSRKVEAMTGLELAKPIRF